MAKHCDLEPFEFILYCGNCHIYNDHFEQVTEQISRTPHPFPTLKILNKRQSINDYVVEDFKIHDYQYHPAIKGVMRALIRLIYRFIIPNISICQVLSLLLKEEEHSTKKTIIEQ